MVMQRYSESSRRHPPYNDSLMTAAYLRTEREQEGASKQLSRCPVTCRAIASEPKRETGAIVRRWDCRPH